ncbi:unnamed protein product [Spirodela intermedia]|uniref:SRP54-type proteins GTP-binding domain-containing protein n=1 Tax=Spirodela intermedia TaxID=51605 RepID=A0A7I8IU96_SPIIN|nr:unnamed protein product [Spirodela intermedia]CAA6661566.1 unnamed protein product [Spirodela intermedia]
MLEELLIFTRGGLILWTCKELGNALKGSPIDTLIRSCLLEERSADASYDYEAPSAGAAYTLKWTFHNELNLVFVAVYQRILRLLYVDDLLAAVKREFAAIYDPRSVARAEEMRKLKQVTARGSGNTTIKKQGQLAGHKVSQRSSSDSGSGKDDADGNLVKANGMVNESRAPGGMVKTDESSDGGAFDVNKLQKLRSKGVKKTNTVVGKVPKAEPKKATKKNRVWDDSPSESQLDFTDPGDQREEGEGEVVAAVQGESMMDKEEELSSDSDDEVDEVRENTQPSSKKGWFTSVLQSISGNTVLEKSDLKPALKALKDRLMTKNVAEEIAEKLCESVAASLEGKSSDHSLESHLLFIRYPCNIIWLFLQTAMEEALLRILTPKRSIDILRDVHVAKDQGKPYVIVFVGVNGVGKSTNLAKVAYWLQQHELKVMMAACDTFRSGAVEQLRTHARRLQVSLITLEEFPKCADIREGYEKDPAIVAKEAIQEAARNHSDVVLVDTAGRMQDNEPLMRALSKLINLNQPDLVLFVGEALVGNDAVDQLTKFDQKLADLSMTPNARLIDGILLTKFDTIDDKVGAALSMVYISGSPVMFVGCGQSYADLKKLNVKSIVKTLLK